MKYFKTIFIIIFIMISINDSKSQIKYFPAGTKAYEKKDSVITFYQNNRPVRIIDLKGYSDLDLRTEEIRFLFVWLFSPSSSFRELYQYNDLGLRQKGKSLRIEGERFVKGEGEYAYNEFGQPFGESYNEYGNIKRKGTNEYIYGDKQELLQVKSSDEKGIVSESVNICDSMGRTVKYYTYNHRFQRITIYKEMEYPNDTTLVAHRTYAYDMVDQSRDFLFVKEMVWHSDKRRDDIYTKVFVAGEDLRTFTIDDFSKLIELVRNENYEHKSVLTRRHEIEFLAPYRVSKVNTFYNYPNNNKWELTEYTYDKMFRLTGQISYEPNSNTEIKARYHYTYNPEDFYIEFSN